MAIYLIILIFLFLGMVEINIALVLLIAGTTEVKIPTPLNKGVNVQKPKQPLSAGNMGSTNMTLVESYITLKGHMRIKEHDHTGMGLHITLLIYIL